MHAALRLIRTTLLAGLVVLLPFWLLILFLAKVLDQIRSVIAPIRRYLPETVVLPDILAALVLVICCFALGLALRTALGRYLREAFEGHILERVPGYSLVRGVAGGLIGGTERAGMEAACVERGDSMVLAVVVERYQGQCTLFIPSAPIATSGSIVTVAENLVHPLGVSLSKALTCLAHYGEGLGPLLANARMGSRRRDNSKT
jgi:uncharacterized membrane protein